MNVIIQWIIVAVLVLISSLYMYRIIMKKAKGQYCDKNCASCSKWSVKNGQCEGKKL